MWPIKNGCLTGIKAVAIAAVVALATTPGVAAKKKAVKKAEIKKAPVTQKACLRPKWWLKKKCRKAMK